MFWNKGQPTSRPPAAGDADAEAIVVESEPAPAGSDDTDLEALEALASVLRSMGRHAFDLDDVTSEESSEVFEKWALRLLVGEVPPAEPDGSRSRRRGIRRDWGGVKRFAEKHRKDEHDYVVTGMANLRQAVRVFIQCTTGGFRAERQSDQVVSQELDDLGRALAVNDHAQIRAAAEKTAATVRGQIEERRSREQHQIDVLQDAMLQLRNELSQMREAAKIDGLTKLFNRAALDEHVPLVADQSFLSGTEACVVMIDIDHFKGINDNYGHQTGDEVLRQVAEALVRGFFRREDFVARYGGEEFCIIAQHTTFDTTRERAERLRQAVESLAITAFGKTLHVSVSFGIAALQTGETSQSWIKRADEALYRAKLKGRNCISIAPPGEALGGSGAPLGATLGLHKPESPRIVHVGGEGARRQSSSPPPESRAPSTRAPSSRAPSSQTVSSSEKTRNRGAGGSGNSRRSARASDSAAPESSSHAPGPMNSGAANQNSEAPPSGRKQGAKRKVGRTRPLGKPIAAEASGTKSPISALLGPGSRR